MNQQMPNTLRLHYITNHYQYHFTRTESKKNEKYCLTKQATTTSNHLASMSQKSKIFNIKFNKPQGFARQRAHLTP